MALLTREQIFAAQDARFETVAVPEWGGDVRVRTMTGTQRDEYEQSLFAARGPDAAVNISNVRARLVAASVVDEAGELMFTQADIEALGAKSAAALDRVAGAARRVSALTAEDIAALGKPSAPTDGAASTSV